MPGGHSTVACTTKLHYGRRVYLADCQAPSSGRTKIEAALEASLGSLDHKCTSFHLAPGGQLCLGYTEEGGGLHANVRDVEGEEVPDVRSEHRPPIPFYPSGDRPRYRRENVFLSLLHI